MNSPENICVKQGNRWLWRYNGGCQYDCEYHRGKVEWHHPIEDIWECGLYLCEAHHSIILGRQKRYSGEILIDKSLSEMKLEIQALVDDVILKAGYELSAINKK